MRERREFQRWRCQLPCTCSAEDLALTGQVVDLSFGGACVAGPTQLPEVGSELEIVLGGDVALKAQVVYLNLERENPRQRDHFGLKFTGSWSARVGHLKRVLQASVEEKSSRAPSEQRGRKGKLCSDDIS